MEAYHGENIDSLKTISKFINVATVFYIWQCNSSSFKKDIIKPIN